MSMTTIRNQMMVGVLCAFVLPVAAQAAPQYLKGQTTDAPIERTYEGDFAEDYRYDGSATGEEAKRQRVEARVKAYMHDIGSRTFPEGGEGTTEADVQKLIADAQAGDVGSIGPVGHAYQYGYGVTQNEKVALEWYKTAIKHGQTQYYTAIGDMYREVELPSAGLLGGIKSMLPGAAVKLKDDDTEARKWYEKGVQGQDWEAYTRLGQMYRDGTGGLTKNMDKANWYYDEGLRRKKDRDAMMMLELEQNARIQAEIEEGLRDPSNRTIGWKKKDVLPSTMIADIHCTLLESGVGAYEAYCGGLSAEQKAEAPATIAFNGQTCTLYQVKENDAGRDYELRCQ